MLVNFDNLRFAQFVMLRPKVRISALTVVLVVKRLLGEMPIELIDSSLNNEIFDINFF